MDWYPPYVPVGVTPRPRQRGSCAVLRKARRRSAAGRAQGQGTRHRPQLLGPALVRAPGIVLRLRQPSAARPHLCAQRLASVTLAIEAGGVEAMVVGRELYRVVVRIRKLKRPTWKAITDGLRRADRIGHRVAAGAAVRSCHGRRHRSRHRPVSASRARSSWRATAPTGPRCASTRRRCSTASAARLDDSPELLFRLRGVDEAELIAADMALPQRHDDGRHPGGRRSRKHLRYRSRRRGRRACAECAEEEDAAVSIVEQRCVLCTPGSGRRRRGVPVPPHGRADRRAARAGRVLGPRVQPSCSGSPRRRFAAGKPRPDRSTCRLARGRL